VLRFDLVEDLADRALLGEVTQLDSEVLLQRLVPALGLALQSGVHVLGDVADQNMRRACRCWSLQGVALSLEDLLAVIAVVGTEVVAVVAGACDRGVRCGAGAALSDRTGRYMAQLS
jgi:hypothetical protein